MIEPIQAFLFDMDGVVIDTHASVEYYWNELAKKYGITLTVEDYERYIHGTQSWATLDRYFGMMTDDEKSFTAEDILVYEDGLAYALMPGVLDFLQSLKHHGIATALVTSGTQRKVDAVFAQVALADKFDVLVTADLVPNGKPVPDCYLLAAERLAVDARRCFVFEDSRSGTQAGIGAGAAVIGIGKTDMVLELGALAVIPNFADVSICDDGRLHFVIPPELDFPVARR